MSFREFTEEQRPAVEEALGAVLPGEDLAPQRLHRAMRYSVFAGGKRVRPLLLLMFGDSMGCEHRLLLPSAAAVELVHTFSLVHDDLPALDDDDLRRGRPTLHKQFDEALAILAGDALLSLGLETIASGDAPAEVRAANVADLARSVGSHYMIGGQVMDLECENAWPPDPQAALEWIHARKTSALFESTLRIACRLAGRDDATIASMTQLGREIGLLFQIRDDLLDLEQTAEVLGKTPGKDAAVRKLTYPALFGEAAARQRLQESAQRAHLLLDELDVANALVRSFLAFLVDRVS